MSGLIRLLLVPVMCLSPLMEPFADDSKKVIGGVQACGSFSQMLESNLKEIKPGLGAGFFVRWQLGNLCALRSELMYNQRGGKRTTEGAAGEVVFTGDQMSLRIHYVELPVMLEFALPGEYGKRPRVLIGPTLGQVLEAGGSSQSIGSASVEYKNCKGQLELGVVAGVGFYSGEPRSWLLDLRLSWMVATLRGSQPYKDRTIQVTVGYALW